MERTIEELARHDATNGTPARSRAAFERALADGARVLGGMSPGSGGRRLTRRTHC